MPFNRGSGSILLIVAAVTAALLAVQPKSPSPKADTPKTPATALKSSTPVEGDPLRPVWAFLNAGSEDGLRPPGARGVPPKTQWPDTEAWKRSNATISFLIATVPDPVDSGLGYMFDQVIEAVQRALEMDHYLIDHTWLPWVRADAVAKPADPPARLHRTQPGLILFRKDVPAAPTNHAQHLHASAHQAPPRRRLLALLLVGETPTAGVHRAAFAAAVKLIQDCPCCVKEEPALRILGPYFSGSQTSLALALGQARPKGAPGPPVHVVCGSASAVNSDTFCAPWLGKGDSFQTTIHSDNLLRKWLYKFLHKPDNPTAGSQPERMVVLQETNTGFGQASTSHEQHGKNGQNSKGNNRVYTIPYPMHISQLRASYTRAQLARMESLGLPRATWDLPFPLAESEKSAEVVPVQDPLMTTALNGLVVNNLMQTIAHWQARHVCLVATDARDAVFLAGLIRDRNPDVQLCTTGGNMLYTHPDYRYALWGMVVASSYPLQPAVQGWGETANPANGHRILFADETYQGCYNATLVHLHHSGSRSAPEHLLDYGPAGEGDGARRPGIWISAVGQNSQMIPLRRIAPAEILADLGPAGDQMTGNPLLRQYELLYQRPVYGQVAQALPVATAVVLPGSPLAQAQLLTECALAPHLPGTSSPPRASVALPRMWWLCFAALTLTAGGLLWRARGWVARSAWGQTARRRLIVYKQRMDFALAAIAVMILYSWLARLTSITLLAGDSEQAGGWILPALALTSALGVILFAAVLVVLVYRTDGRKRGGGTAGSRLGLWERVKLRWEEYGRVIAKAPPLRGLTGRWFAHAPATPAGGVRWFGRSGVWLVAGEILLFLAALYCACAVPAMTLWRTATATRAQNVLDFERLTSPPSGLSPFVPVFFLCAALFAWGLFLAKKQYLASKFSVGCPFPAKGAKEFERLARLDRGLRAELMPPSTWQRHPRLCLLVFGLLLLVFWKLTDRATPTIDGELFGVLSLAGFFVGAFLLVFTLLQVCLAWRELRRLLHRLAQLPMAEAFGRLPEKAVEAFGRYFTNLRRHASYLAVVCHQARLFRRLFPACREQLLLSDPQLDGSSPEFLRSAAGEFAQQFPEGKPDLPAAVCDAADEQATDKGLTETAPKVLAVLHELWPAHALADAFGRPVQETAPASAPLYLSLPEKHPVREWAVAAEDFVALQVVRYVSQFSVQLRNLLTSMSVGSLLLLLAAVIYPFRPQSLLVLVLMTLCGAVAVRVILFLVEINRDELVSRIMRSTPNRFTPDLHFLDGTLKYVLPIVGGLLVQFPFFTSALRSFFEPLLHIIH